MTSGAADVFPIDNREGIHRSVVQSELHAEEVLVDAGVVGDFRMERCGEDIALLQRHRVAARRGHHARPGRLRPRMVRG